MIDLSKYKNIALHFSGGKDSLALLYLYKDMLKAMTVYHLDTGDSCPETQEIVDWAKEWVPNFVVVNSDVATWREVNGYPSDLVPAKAHAIGVSTGMNDFPITNRFDCCYANIMKPMHDRMIQDEVDCVIRGTKIADSGKLAAEGKTEYYDVILPIRDWSHDDVFNYLKENDAPENAIYSHFASASAPECFGCTAWWDDNKAKYLKKLHPQQFEIYRNNLGIIANTISSHVSELSQELGV
jgi:3'-phosphoadenosine 5'-phosphosulfate sulfotransferase (PAPS reductase)/FAD synthetase